MYGRRVNIKHGNGGFTLIEILAAVIIIGAITAFALPKYFRSVDKADEAACIGNIEKIKTSYSANNFDSSQPFKDAVKGVMAAIPNATTESASDAECVFGGMCPDGGKYTIKKEGERVLVTCSVHNAPVTAVTLDKIIQAILSMADDPNSALSDYFSKYSSGSKSLDSEGMNWAPDVSAELNKIIGQDISDCSWRVWTKYDSSGKPQGYNIFWTQSNISGLKVGDIVSASKYSGCDNPSNPTIISGTMTIKESTDGINKFNILDGGSFTAD